MHIPSPRTLNKYNLTVTQYIRLWDLTGGRCPLCQKKFRQRPVSRNPVIDHDHKNGMVRGLLCSACNYELGCLHDNDGWLQAAANYLRHPTAIQINLIVYVPGAPPALETDNPSKAE